MNNNDDDNGVFKIMIYLEHFLEKRDHDEYVYDDDLD